MKFSTLSLSELLHGLRHLTFSENFQSNFLVNNQTIVNGTTATFTHNLGAIPAGRLILAHSGDSAIVDGAWTSNTVQIKNTGSAPATVTILYFLVI